jgi:arylamine N-acetyltransferase
VQQMQINDEWLDLYSLTLDPVPPIDLDMGNWWMSTNSASRFRQDLVLARMDDTKQVRYTLLNKELTIRAQDGSVEKLPLPSVRDILDAAAKYFGVQLPADTQFAIPNAPW